MFAYSDEVTGGFNRRKFDQGQFLKLLIVMRLRHIV